MKTTKPLRRIGNLPAETTRLVGRQAELVQVQEACGRARLVTLTGVGGVGKTRLAVEAARAMQPRFRDGAWLVELSPLRQDTLLAHTIAEALPLADQTTRPMIDVLADYLADRELLLVLDTCEHLIDGCALTVQLLLAAAPGLRVLVTSRLPLGLRAERVLAIGPLPVPEGDGGDDDPAAWQSDAVVLLSERAAETVSGFAVADADRADLVRLVRRLDGLPLAIELAAARLGELSVTELTARLEDRFAVLGTTDEVVYDADPPWHQALRTAIGWSHELCTPRERLLWARLSVFAGGFDAEAARRVCTDERLPDEMIPALLSRLAAHSLLTRQRIGDGERYGMLDTIREYGAGWLRGLGEERTLRHRHRDCFHALAHRADAAWMGPGQIAWRDRMTAEHDNLRAALDLCLAEEDGHTALEIGGALWFFWIACGFIREGRYYLERALAIDAEAGPARAKALWACGCAASVQGDDETRRRLAVAFGQAVAEDTDETARIAAVCLEGIGLTESGRQARAAEVLDAVPHSPPPGGRYGGAWFMARGGRAFVHIHLGQFDRAAAVADELCAECDRRGEIWCRAWGDYLRALAALGVGRTEEAAVHARTALDCKHRLHDSIGIAMAIDLLASTAIASRHAERAARLLGTAEHAWRTLGTPQKGMPELIAAREACEQQARRLLGDDAYQAAFRTGYDTDTGIAYALNTPGIAPPHAPSD
ncbi:ATP-binding protein [Streptomyces sp. NPDC053542]|uniref:ATP-binding protein n=1 Tax=Streptomyces sp. NPDC053542 TaxID=3365710 RepID=UPI0037D2FE29